MMLRNETWLCDDLPRTPASVLAGKGWPALRAAQAHRHYVLSLQRRVNLSAQLQVTTFSNVWTLRRITLQRTRCSMNPSARATRMADGSPRRLSHQPSTGILRPAFYPSPCSLLEHGATGLAEAGLLPTQAGGDRPHVGNFARAKPVDVRRTRPPLLRGCGHGHR